MKQKILLFTVFLIIAATGILALFGEKVYSYFQSDTIFKDMDSGCDLHANSCEVIFDSGKSIKLDISKPIKTGENFTLNAYASGFHDSKLEVVIYGVDMNMGIFNYTLEKTTDGVYSGIGSLPMCMHGKMSWRVNIISKKDNIGASFTLELL
ncbi:MAG: hypothetical protein LBL65_06155 [Campylobacteraceae bacterium]|jgi:hypothetical protein|nr:hypothetical protein [Campylobacteraceae bacterium]